MFPELEKYLRDLAARSRSMTEPEAVAVEALEAVLTGASVLFHTLNNDKDGDTRLEVWVNKAGNREAAYSGFVFGHYDDWSYHRVSLAPKTNLMTKAEIPGAFIRVHIEPNGNDTWIFEQVPVELYFSDGTVYRKNFGPATLSQDSKQADFPL
jgi:hypothetical protein